MDLAEFALLVSVLILPPVLGVVAAALRKPWWWAAAAAFLVFLIAAIAPTPEAGEPRIAVGDLLFLLVAAVWIAALAWLAHFLVSRFWMRRPEPGALDTSTRGR